MKVLLPSPYALGGTSYVPAFYLRPFVEYVDGGEKHQRWDEVPNDYFIGAKFDRGGEILAR